MARQQSTRWQDQKRWAWSMGPMFPLTVLGGLALYARRPTQHHWTWLTPLMIHAAIPLADWLCGEDQDNISEADVPALEQDPYYQRLLYAYLPSQYAVTALGTILALRRSTPWWAKLGLLLTVGAVNGMAINVAHELGHKKNKRDRHLAQLTLAPSAYGHHVIEHHFGHHRHVATPEDASSAKLGETLWEFMPRSLIGSVKTAIDIEKTRLQRQHKSFWHPHNELLQGWAISITGVAVMVGATRSWASVPFLMAQALYGGSLLEVVNYLEHYGLLRQKQSNGQYERCAPCHSWNSNSVVTNLVLYQLQRHADHHAHPTRSFQCLRHFDDSPQLPAGYGAMIVTAYFPRWWFAIMDHRVAAHYQGDVSRANLHPRRGGS
jgi:alkane 1-monooxygenase